MYTVGKNRFLLALLLALVTLAGVSCGGNTQVAGGGIGGTGITSGTVTGFGSIFVNGVEFDTNGATRTVDDTQSISNGSDDRTVLGQGMVVAVTGTVNPDGRTGTATAISYDEEVEGPMQSAPVENAGMTAKTFTIFDTTVVADSNATVYVNTDYLSLSVNRVLEVSGFYDTTGRLLATRIVDHGALTPTSVVQLKGNISAFNGVDTFMLGSVTVHYDATTVITGLAGGVADGQDVEVVGTLSNAGTSSATISATAIQQEQPSILPGGYASVEGVVTGFNGIGDFHVAGQPVNASNAVFTPAQLQTSLSDDQRVEVEGTAVAGVLVATQVRQRDGNVVLAGQVTVVNPLAGTFGVEIVSGQPPLTVTTDSRTQMEDEQTGAITIADLNAGDQLVVEGYVTGGRVIARQLERNVLDRYELKGPVDMATGTAAAGSVTVLGVTMLTDSATRFTDSAGQLLPNGGDDFFSQVQPGMLVDLRDRVPVDGIADQAQLGQ